MLISPLTSDRVATPTIRCELATRVVRLTWRPLRSHRAVVTLSEAHHRSGGGASIDPIHSCPVGRSCILAGCLRSAGTHTRSDSREHSGGNGYTESRCCCIAAGHAVVNGNRHPFADRHSTAYGNRHPFADCYSATQFDRHSVTQSHCGPVADRHSTTYGNRHPFADCYSATQSDPYSVT